MLDIFSLNILASILKSLKAVRFELSKLVTAVRFSCALKKVALLFKSGEFAKKESSECLFTSVFLGGGWLTVDVITAGAVCHYLCAKTCRHRELLMQVCGGKCHRHSALDSAVMPLSG